MNDELTKTGAKALDRLTELLAKLAGPAAEELGETMRDSLKVYRLKRQLRLMKRIDEMTRAAGFDPRAVPLRLLFPALEQATIEEDDDLQDLWAALIANASDPRVQSPVQPYFVDILRQLTKDQALFLQAIFNFVTKPKDEKSRKEYDQNKSVFGIRRRSKWSVETFPSSVVMLSEKTLYDLYKECFPIAEPQQILLDVIESEKRKRRDRTAGNTQLATAVDNLIRLGLLREFTRHAHEHCLTSMGFQFMCACIEPGPMADASN